MKPIYKTTIYTGVIAGLTLSLFLIAIFFSINLFNYDIEIKPIKLNAITELKTKETNQLLKEIENTVSENLIKNKSILTPADYTSNISNYYNALLVILSVIIAIITAVNIQFFKAQIQFWINESINNDDFKEQISELVIGNAEKRNIEDLEKLESQISDIKNIIRDLQENQTKSEIL